MARPTKLTTEIQERIVKALQLGVSYEHAAHYGGISYRTLSRWMETGQKEEDSEYGDFYCAVRKARSDMIIGCLLKIEQAANKGDWKASAWKLERMYPKLYGRRIIKEE
jgi:hypothetical protein